MWCLRKTTKRRVKRLKADTPIVAVLGAGSWGTALAMVLGKKGYEVRLWDHFSEQVAAITADRENKRYLPGFPLPASVIPTAELRYAVSGVSMIVMVVPTHGYRDVYQRVTRHISSGITVVSASKGIENESLKTMTQIMTETAEVTGVSIQTAVLSGPSFAKEVAAEVPTAVTVACNSQEAARYIQRLFNSEYFRAYTSIDTIGLEVSGALKNIIAIAAGICDGLEFGTNARAALITRGLAEITRFGVAQGAQAQTFYGLSGVGDLVLTCTGDLSRNRHVGLELGRGNKLEQILGDMCMVAEGVKTTKSVYNIVEKTGLDMPILEQVYQILYHDKDCGQAVRDLLNRDLKAE